MYDICVPDRFKSIDRVCSSTMLPIRCQFGGNVNVTLMLNFWSRTKISENFLNILEGYQNIRKFKNIESTKISEN